MRCPECNKFVSMEAGDPEVEDITILDDEVKCTVRLVVNCAECGNELKEYMSEPSELLQDKLYKATGYDEHFDEEGEPIGDECEMMVEETGVEPMDKIEKRKTLHGAEINYEVKCTCSKGVTFCEGTLESDYVATSDMEECC